MAAAGGLRLSSRARGGLFLGSAGAARTLVEYRRGETIFMQGDPCEHVMYIHSGGVKLTARSKSGREAVVAMLGPGDFFGEGCLAGQRARIGCATAITPSAILFVGRRNMMRLLHERHTISDRFISHMLARKIRIEEDLLDQLFSSIEKRLARALLLLACYGTDEKPARVVRKIPHETLAKTIGATPARINFFLRKFQRLGFIDYTGKVSLKIDSSLLSVVLNE